MQPRDLTNGWAAVAGLGVIAALVGLTDFGLVWVPPDFGNAEWEFGTISAAVDGLPLATVGLGLLGAASVFRGWRGVSLVIGVLGLILCISLIGAVVVYSLDVPLALRAVAPEVKGALSRAIGKTMVHSPGYIVFYAWFGVYLLRRARAPRSS